MNIGADLKPVVKPVILTVEQIDKTDLFFDLFVSDSDEYHFTDTIIVQETVAGYRIVDGFEIIKAELPDHYKFPGVCFQKDESFVDILSILVKNRVTKRPLFPIETARVFQLARKQGVSYADLMESFFPMLGLKSDESLNEQYFQLLFLNESIVDYLIDKNAPLKTWMFITKFNPTDQFDLQDLIRLRPTLSVFEEITICLHEIQKRESLSLPEVLKQLHWAQLLNDENLLPKKRIGQIRNTIFMRRFPLLSTHKESVEKALNQISIPENASIRYDDTFEKKELRLDWRLNTESDIDKMRNFYTDDTIQRIRQMLDVL